MRVLDRDLPKLKQCLRLLPYYAMRSCVDYSIFWLGGASIVEQVAKGALVSKMRGLYLRKVLDLLGWK